MPQQEAWLRGPVPGVSPFLQPVAHALVQARDEVGRIVTSLPDDVLWERPSGVASAGFHLQHICGVIDRLFTYARGEPLSHEQLLSLTLEGHPPAVPTTARALGHAFDACVESALAQLRATDDEELTEVRAVGRAQIPSTVIGLLVHAAEHTTRHVGQLLVTARVVSAGHPVG